jgi:hypothetical protein
MQVFLHVSRRAAMEAAEERKHAATDSNQTSVCSYPVYSDSLATMIALHCSAMLYNMKGFVQRSRFKHHVLAGQGVDAQPLADGVPDDDDDDVLSEEEAEQHALLQPQPAPQPGGEPELPPVASDPAFEHSGALTPTDDAIRNSTDVTTEQR